MLSFSWNEPPHARPGADWCPGWAEPRWQAENRTERWLRDDADKPSRWPRGLNVAFETNGPEWASRRNLDNKALSDHPGWPKYSHPQIPMFWARRSDTIRTVAAEPSPEMTGIDFDPEPCLDDRQLTFASSRVDDWPTWVKRQIVRPPRMKPKELKVKVGYGHKESFGCLGPWKSLATMPFIYPLRGNLP